MDQDNVDDRLETLEMRVAYQERSIEEMTAVITEQWKLIETLTRKLNTLDEQVRSGAHIADPATEKPPPHY